MRIVRSDDVDAVATVELGLEAARKTAEFVARDQFAAGRVQVGDTKTWTRILCGIVPELGLTGYKELHRVGKRVYYHVSLFDYETGDSIGIVDGRRITSLRTAATAALAVQHAMGDEPLTLAVIGSGEEAREGLRALAGAVTVTEARIFSPTPANREALADEASAEMGVSARAVASVAEAFDGANMSYVATAATTPVVSAADVAGTRFVAAVGATRPDHHELTGDVVCEASQVIVDCHDASDEPGDCIDAAKNFGWDSAGAILLGKWLTQPYSPNGGAPGLFKSIGSVEQDIVLAHELLKATEARGLGEVIDPIGSLREMR